jgi:heme exporter protein D
MGLLTGLIRLVPGFRHIAAGRTVAGVMWFAAFAVFLNFGLLAPVAWPGYGTRVARGVLCGMALIVVGVSHRRATVVERLERRQAGRRPAGAGVETPPRA